MQGLGFKGFWVSVASHWVGFPKQLLILTRPSVPFFGRLPTSVLVLLGRGKPKLQPGSGESSGKEDGD